MHDLGWFTGSLGRSEFRKAQSGIMWGLNGNVAFVPEKPVAGVSAFKQT